MAKSGQCNSQKRHPIQSSGRSITGAPISLLPITFLGQKALQIPHDLHHAGIIWGEYFFLLFLLSFSAGGLDLCIISIFSASRVIISAHSSKSNVVDDVNKQAIPQKHEPTGKLDHRISIPPVRCETVLPGLNIKITGRKPKAQPALTTRGH